MLENEIVIIPESSELSLQFQEIADSTRLVIFSGLPGVGKSLYVREFCRIAKSRGKTVEMIQWDVARKAFETEYISEHFPMGEGTVHNGLKLIAGDWLMKFLKDWIKKNSSPNNLLIVEAPLVGHRFVELAHVNEDGDLEDFLASKQTKVIVPIPTKRIRRIIEDERARQVKEDAKVWSGAKPSVMLELWKDTCAIANEFGMDIDLSVQPPYSDGIYEYVYSLILKNRHLEALIIDEIFEVPEMDESFLHQSNSIKASGKEADDIGKLIKEKYSLEQIDTIVDSWYKT